MICKTDDRLVVTIMTIMTVMPVITIIAITTRRGTARRTIITILTFRTVRTFVTRLCVTLRRIVTRLLGRTCVLLLCFWRGRDIGTGIGSLAVAFCTVVTVIATCRTIIARGCITLRRLAAFLHTAFLAGEVEFKGFDAFKLGQRNIHVDGFVDRSNKFAVFGYGQHEGLACATCTTGTAGTMDVILGVEGHVEVKDVRDIGNVNAARGNVRADQQGDFARFEFIKRFGAFALDQIAMHATGIKTVLGQRFEQNIDVFFAVAEHKSVFDVFLTD